MGQIYIIKNYMNDKVYIGQTVQPLKRRFACHILHSNINSIHTKLHTAMRELGSDNFYIESILECKNSELNKFEIEYIKKYDSYHNGYNSTSGGAGIKHDKIYDEYIDEFISDYYKLTLWELCVKYKISESLVYSIINTIGITKKENYTVKRSNKAIAVVKYDINFKPIKYYNAISQAIIELNIDKRNSYGRIKAACQNGNIAYGHRWQLASDLVYEDKIFRTKFDKEAYIQGKPAYQPEGKQYWIVDNVLDSFISVINTKCVCEVCGKHIDRKSRLCINCYNEIKRKNIPTKEQLQSLISQYSYEEIGRQYGVTGKSVRKWCDSYNISKEKKEKPSKEQLEYLLNTYSTKQIAEMYRVHPGTVNWWASNYNIQRSKGIKIKCIEMGLVFNSKIEAAKYLIDNKLTSATEVHNLAYRLGQCIDNDETYNGFHWKLI